MRLRLVADAPGEVRAQRMGVRFSRLQPMARALGIGERYDSTPASSRGYAVAQCWAFVNYRRCKGQAGAQVFCTSHRDFIRRHLGQYIVGALLTICAAMFWKPLGQYISVRLGLSEEPASAKQMQSLDAHVAALNVRTRPLFSATQEIESGGPMFSQSLNLDNIARLTLVLFNPREGEVTLALQRGARVGSDDPSDIIGPASPGIVRKDFSLIGSDGEFNYRLTPYGSDQSHDIVVAGRTFHVTLVDAQLGEQRTTFKFSIEEQLP